MAAEFGLPGEERTFDKNSIIVSKTDTKGIITYANDIFLDIADYKENEVMGKPHNIIRHDFMPKSIYQLFWGNLQSGQEIFAFVVNRTKYNDYYWVLANASPTYNDNQEIIGYHSNRRVPNQNAIKVIAPIYIEMKKIEASLPTKEGMAASFKYLTDLLEQNNTTYEEFVYGLQQGTGGTV